MRLREYTHDGHPGVAGQYSQGWFDIGETTETMESLRDSLESERKEHVVTDSGFAYFTYEIDEETEPAEITLRVEQICNQSDHDSDECTCWEYVHAYRLEDDI